MGISYYHNSLNHGETVRVRGTGNTERIIKITSGPTTRRGRQTYSGAVIGGNDETAPPNVFGREAWFYVDDVLGVIK